MTECEFNVEFAELIDAFGAVQDFVERPSVLFDHTHPQSAGTGVLHSVWFVSLGGAQRGPGQGGDLYGRFGEQVGLAGEQFDERSRRVPLVGAGGMTWGRRRSKVAASSCEELLKWR